MTHTHEFEEIEVWGVRVCRTCGVQTTEPAPRPPAQPHATRTPTCHDPSGCTNPGTWREIPSGIIPNRYARMLLCDFHAARWHRRSVDFPSTQAIQAAKERHPSNASGGAALRRAFRHPLDCTCGTCGYHFAHADDAVDA